MAVILCGCGESSRTVKKELEDAQAQLTSANRQIISLNSQLAAADAKITELTPFAQKARELPLRVTALRTGTNTNAGYQILNLSGTPLAVRVKLTNPTYQHSKTITCVLPAARPAPPYEIGASSGWPAATGDVLEMVSEGYDVMTNSF